MVGFWLFYCWHYLTAITFYPSTGSIASTFIEVPGGIFKTQVYVGNVLADGDLNWSMDMQLDLVKYGKM